MYYTGGEAINRNAEAELTAEIVELYLQVRLKSEASRKQYSRIVDQLCAALGRERDELYTVSRAEAMRFVRHLRGGQGQRGRALGQSTKVTEGTVRRKHIILKSIFAEMHKQRVIEANPFEFPMVVAGPAQKRPTQPVPFDMVVPICDMPGKDRKGRQDRGMLACLFGNGGRRGEIPQLKIGHCMVLQNGALKYDVLHTKGGNMQTKYLPPWASERVTEWITYRKDMEGADGNSFIFTGPNKLSPVSDSTVYRRFKKWIKAAGLNADHYSPHSTRATLVTWMRQARKADGAAYDDKEIMAVTGHTCRASLDAYDERVFEGESHPVMHVHYGE
jgi:site-specific recombinase XerC